MPDPPSSPLKLISLSCVATVKSTSVELFVNVSILVPSSLNITSAPPASKTISVVESNVIVDPESISAITGVVKVLFVKVAVEDGYTNLASPPVLGRVKTLLALSECGAATIC